MSLSVALDAEVARRGISWTAAAERIGSTQQSLSRWRLGQATPTAEWHAPLAKFLHVPLEELRRMVATQRNAMDVNARLAALEARVEALEKAPRKR